MTRKRMTAATLVFLLWMLAAPFAASQTAAMQDPCDLNKDGLINLLDVQLAVNMALGETACEAGLLAGGDCNVITVQRIINAGLGESCVAGAAHSVTLNWVASTSPNIAGYSVYRGASGGGPYTRITPGLVKTTEYVDTAVQSGRTYYYVVTATDASAQESGYSNEASAAVP